MNKSEDIKELATAMIAVQRTALQAQLNADNPYFGSKYADLGEVWRVAKEVLPENGIVVFQVPSYGADGFVQVETTLCHAASGQWVSGVVALRPVKQDPQAFGSCITYARRYGLACMVGIVADSDDDANAASAPQGAPTTKTVSEPAAYVAQPEVGNPAWEPDPEPTMTAPDPEPTMIAPAPPTPQWKSAVVPFGANKGMTLGQLTKAKLFGWWANWVPKPYMGKIQPKDIEFRKALDAAGAYYNFRLEAEQSGNE